MEDFPCKPRRFWVTGGSGDELIHMEGTREGLGVTSEGDKASIIIFGDLMANFV